MTLLATPGAREIGAWWRELAVHAGHPAAEGGCDECREPVHDLRLVAERPQAADYQAADKLCPVGRELFERWREDKSVWIERIKGPARAVGLEGMDEPAVLERAEALMEVPGDQFRRLIGLPEQERMAQVEAIERSYIRRGAPPPPRVAEPASAEVVSCEVCGKQGKFRGRYCSRECRLKGAT